MTEFIIGFDCATQDRKVGLARAEKRAGRWSLTDALIPGPDRPVLEFLREWLQIADQALLAVDAPLGWPATLPEALAGHHAGDDLKFGPNKLFRRETDQYIARIYKKTPLDVGADRIARTAHSALTYLGALRSILKDPIPLVWDWRRLPRYSVIEVYPAATMRAHGLSLAGYRKREGVALRRRLCEFVLREVPGDAKLRPEDTRVDALDAAVCVVAGRDFLEGSAGPPADLHLARKEGWIWTRRTDGSRVEGSAAQAAD